MRVYIQKMNNDRCPVVERSQQIRTDPIVPLKKNTIKPQKTRKTSDAQYFGSIVREM